MLFNSPAFVLFFLPVVVLGFYICRDRYGQKASTLWLVLASFFFYGWWDVRYVPLLLLSIIINYFTGNRLIDSRSKPLLALGVLFNLGLLGYFKYADFFMQNMMAAMGEDWSLLNIVLPLGISFFTFQQIAFLVDSYRKQVPHKGFLNYSLFVSFFPQLIAGPIVHHSEMMPQFDKKRRKIDYDQIAKGLALFAIGLVKKVWLADHFATVVNAGYAIDAPLNMVAAWTVSLSYTLQLYFDFSGYMDMATGAALLLGIKLPQNFNAPYKATSIQDFWRRWHITLGRFLKDYVYIPLGGNRVKQWRVPINLFLTFLIGGLWHGAAWTFVVWGALHGIAIVLHRTWTKIGCVLPRFVAWLLTFLFVHLTWVFFRAESVDQAWQIIKAMFGQTDIILYYKFAESLSFLGQYGVKFERMLDVVSGDGWTIPVILLGLLLCWFGRTSLQVVDRFKPKALTAVLVAAAMIGCMITQIYFRVSYEFIYFQF